MTAQRTEDVLRQQELLQQLTLDEKIALCSGIDFWRIGGIERLGIPAILLTDGPHGLRKQAENYAQVDIRGVPATCFPTASATANSWNRELLFAVGSAIAEECLQEDVGVVLGPGINIKRSPLCGRNFEYFSEDPLLSGELAAEFIDGVQSRGIGTSLKHFAVNNQEARRNSIDAIVDARALREIYLAGFEIAVRKAQPWTVMSAYNKVNGVYCGEHELLLDKILREEWGFKGLVVSDWGGCNERVAGLEAGLDLEMPSSSGLNGARIRAALDNGTLDTATLDRSAMRVLALIQTAAAHRQPGYRCDRDAHHRLAQRAAAESAVLFKNDGALLPLQSTARIAVLGALAAQPRFQGAGSSQITAWRIDNALDACRRHAAQIVYAAGYVRNADIPDAALLAEAVDAARAAEVVVIFAGLTEGFESEGFDRTHLRLPDNHNALIEQVAAVNSNVVVVLTNGAPVTMPWIDSVKAVLGAFLAGQAGGSAIADLLFGIANPSGKLAETYPLRLEDNPSLRYFPGGPDSVEYRESLYVGYRFYDTAQKAVLFPFGHGLGYSAFEYSDLRLSQQRIAEDEPLTVSVRIRNVGARAGAEVVQVYVRDVESSVFRPHKELKEFGKCYLQPHAERTLEFTLPRRAFAFYDADAAAWRVEGGEFEILIGASSADIRARATVSVDAEKRSSSSEKHSASMKAQMPAYFQLDAAGADGALTIDDRSFAALYGAPLPEPRRNGRFDLNSTLGDIRSTFIGRQLHAGVVRNMRKMAPVEPAQTKAELSQTNAAPAQSNADSAKPCADSANSSADSAKPSADSTKPSADSAKPSADSTMTALMEAVVSDMALRQLAMFSGGRLSFELLEGLISIMNGQRWRGFRQLVAAALAGRRRS